MEFFTIAAGISVHVWDTKDEKDSRSEPGVTNDIVMPGLTGHLKPCVVLLHGYLETMYIFNDLVDALKPYYRIITLDLPGHGLTDSAPAGADGTRVNSLSFCASVVAGVLDKCGVQQAVIAGHSLGGYVTLQFLKDFPQRAAKAVLIHSHPYPDAPEKSEDRAREKRLIADGKLQAIAAISIPNMYYEENLRACDEKIRETVELCETHDPEGIIASIEGLRTRPDSLDVMAHPPVPLLLIYGDHDAFLPLEKVAEMMQSFPEVSYSLVPESGHNSFIEQESAFVEALTAFIDSSLRSE